MNLAQDFIAAVGAAIAKLPIKRAGGKPEITANDAAAMEGLEVEEGQRPGYFGWTAPTDDVPPDTGRAEDPVEQLVPESVEAKPRPAWHGITDTFVEPAQPVVHYADLIAQHRHTRQHRSWSHRHTCAACEAEARADGIIP